MRTLFKAFLLGLALFGTVAVYSQLVANSRFLARSHESLRLFAQLGPAPDAAERQRLIDTTLRRARVYEAAIERTHLVDGMLVNRTASGGTEDTCDSLLFSGLRFVALKKLGFEREAAEAWTALEKSQAEGLWIRHPRCGDRATSRDMIMGLLVALSQKPENQQGHLRLLLAQVAKRDGYFSFGPRYVSYLTPTLARLLRLVATAGDIDPAMLPPVVRDGYSVEELSVAWINPGFEAHLVGLATWLELELLQSEPGLRAQAGAPLLGGLSDLTTWATGADLEKQRLQWTTSRLVELDPQNLFFRYLRLRAADALTHKTAATMVTELMAMRQFPEGRLPRDCDRSADYLWQRGSWEHHGRRRCNRIFSGTDYLWMSGLLVEALQPQDVYTRSH